jgi:hypothetical protein
MGTKSLRYDHPAILSRDGEQIVCPAVAASTISAKFIAFAKTRIKSIRGITRIAGTDAAAGYDLYNGTSSLGAFTTGTQTAGSAIAALTQNIVLNPGESLDFKTKANSATTANDFVVEFELTADALVTI